MARFIDSCLWSDFIDVQSGYVVNELVEDETSDEDMNKNLSMSAKDSDNSSGDNGMSHEDIDLQIFANLKEYEKKVF